MSSVEVSTSRDVNLLTGEEIVRVRYRPEGKRRWTKLVVTPTEGQSIDDLIRQSDLIAQAHMESKRA